jgi:hypothetical protein
MSSVRVSSDSNSSCLVVISYHMYLLSIGQTTNEHLKRIYRDDLNPSNHGCCSNTASICGENQTSKLPSMRERLSVEQYISEAMPLDPESRPTLAARRSSRNAWTVVSPDRRDSISHEIKDGEDKDASDFSSEGEEADVNQEDGTVPASRFNTEGAIINPMISR